MRGQGGCQWQQQRDAKNGKSPPVDDRHILLNDTACANCDRTAQSEDGRFWVDDGACERGSGIVSAAIQSKNLPLSSPHLCL